MLPDWLTVVILGIVEGLTEFIPVSSTGHLLIAEKLIGVHKSDLFNVVIQSGAVLAVIPLFRKRIEMLLKWREPQSLLFNLKIVTAFVMTAVGGFVIDKKGIKLPETVSPVAWALLIGGILFVLVEILMRGKKFNEEITWPVVLVMAAGQLIAAMFPGASRSGTTIILAMMIGASRISATEFSFLIGIPTLLAAGGYKILKCFLGGSTENWGLLLLGSVVAAAVSFVAVKWMLRYVQHHTFIGFGIYRIVIGAILLGWSIFSSLA